MELNITFSRKRLEKLKKDLEQLKQTVGEKKHFGRKYLLYKYMEILDELSKQVVIYSKEDYDLRMQVIKEFTEEVKEMSFSHFILCFPNNEGYEYTNVEALFRNHANNIELNGAIGKNANILISELDVNKELNKFKEQITLFMNDKKIQYFGNGEINVDFVEKEQSKEDKFIENLFKED